MKNFISLSKEYGNALRQGDDVLANKIHGKLTKFYSKVKRQGSWEIFYQSVDNEDECVQLCSATFLLKHDEELAIAKLEELINKNCFESSSASITLDMWKKGMLELL